MSSEQALLTCTFSWGKTCSLYCDSIEIAGKAYDLKDLTAIHPSYRVVLGVPSARLELAFGGEHLILRGIADLDIARLMVSHLQPYCLAPTSSARFRSRSARGRKLARAQARAWERTGHLPVVHEGTAENEFTPRTSDLLKHTDALGEVAEDPQEAEVVDGISLDAVPKAPLADTSLTPGETLEAFARLASNLSTYVSPLPDSVWQPPHTPRFQPPLHSVHLIPPHQKFDSSSMPVPVVKSSVLPIIHVPVRLLHGECAHYSIGATLCSDRISSSDRATYPMLDQGLLILTNRRVLYIGKRCQFTLAYTHLWYVSLLHTALALHIEGQFRRIIIELEHPHEWASRIELLSFIARRERPEPPTQTVAAVPGLNMTVKRPAVKPPAAKPAPVDVSTLPLLSERATSIVEARTVEMEDEAHQACAQHETLDLPSEPAREPLELVKSNTPRITANPAQAGESEHKAAQKTSLENITTQDIPLQADVTEMSTQEFAPPAAEVELVDAPTQAISRRADISERDTSDISPTQPTELGDASTQAISRRADISERDTSDISPAQPAELGDASTQAISLQAEKTQRAQPPEPSTEDLSDDDDDDRTIHLNERKLCQLRTISMRTTEPARPPDSQTTNKRFPRVRAGIRR